MEYQNTGGNIQFYCLIEFPQGDEANSDITVVYRRKTNI